MLQKDGKPVVNVHTTARDHNDEAIDFAFQKNDCVKSARRGTLSGVHVLLRLNPMNPMSTLTSDGSWWTAWFLERRTRLASMNLRRGLSDPPKAQSNQADELA